VIWLRTRRELQWKPLREALGRPRRSEGLPEPGTSAKRFQAGVFSAQALSARSPLAEHVGVDAYLK
jgi:hypothetical protein